MKVLKGVSVITCSILSTAMVFGSDYSVEVFDQVHADLDAYELYHNIEVYRPLGQSFRAGLGGLDFVDLWLVDIGSWESEEGSLVKVALRSGNLDGVVKAESGVVRIENGFDGVVRFAFRSRIHLNVEESYLVELIHMEGEPTGVRNYGELFPRYERGNLFLGGVESMYSDLWFRTGVVVDEILLVDTTSDALNWEGISPLVYEVWSSLDLRSWELLEGVTSESINYEYRYSNIGRKPRFFRVKLSG